MANLTDYPDLADLDYIRIIGPAQRYRHAADPEHLGRGLCGARIKGTARSGTDCPLCEALIHGNRSWVTR